MTQQQVADTLRKDVTSISKVENGKGCHQISTIRDIASALDCELKIDIIPKNFASAFKENSEIIDKTILELDFK